MKLRLGLVLLGLCAVGCSALSESGSPQDLGAQEDLSTPPDFAIGKTLSLLSGGLGAPGNLDGTGSAARFQAPYGVALDGAGNLYVADAGNHAIRQIKLANVEVTTFAGVLGLSGVRPGPLPASLNQPFGLVVLPGGVIYLSNIFENALLEVR